jgi:hypothetical protein
MVRMIGGPQGPGRCLRCLRRSAEGTGYRPPTRGGVVGFCFVNFWPSSGLAHGTIRRGGACCKRTGTCEGWPPGPRKVWQMLWAFGRGHGVSIPHQRRGNWPLFRQLLILWVYRPGHKRRGGGCFKPTWYVCGWSPGPRKVRQMLQAFSGGNVPSIPH